MTQEVNQPLLLFLSTYFSMRRPKNHLVQKFGLGILGWLFKNTLNWISSRGKEGDAGGFFLGFGGYLFPVCVWFNSPWKLSISVELGPTLSLLPPIFNLMKLICVNQSLSSNLNSFRCDYKHFKYLVITREASWTHWKVTLLMIPITVTNLYDACLELHVKWECDKVPVVRLNSCIA